MKPKQRLVTYLILGGLLCLVGVSLMFIGGFAGSVTVQLAGVIVYAASIPLLLWTKISRIQGRIEQLERRLRE